MVRFSDMLGGSGEPDDARAANSPFAALKSDELDAESEPEPEAEDEAEDEPEDEPGVETPEDVLNRLTRYASAARATDRELPPEPVDSDSAGPSETEDVPPDEPLPPVGDDFLPDPKGVERRSGRTRKRRP